MQKKLFRKVAAIKSNGAESEYYIYPGPEWSSR